MDRTDHWEPMPGWYVELSDVARDEGAPEAVRLSAAAAIQYVDDLRRDYKRLRDMEQRAQEVRDGRVTMLYQEEAEQMTARYILGEPIR